MSGDATSAPRPMAGNEDVIMMIQRISIGARGKTERLLTSLKERPTRRVNACMTLPARRCKQNLAILSTAREEDEKKVSSAIRTEERTRLNSASLHMRRPSSIALRIEAKLSSVSTMSEALRKLRKGQRRSAACKSCELRSLLGDVATVHSHSNTNVSTLERRTVVHTISGCQVRK